MQCFLIKNDASHSTICFNDRRGIAERASFGRIFHSLKGKIHGSIFLLLLGYAFGFAPLQPTALGTDQDIIRAIEENRALLQSTIVGSQATTDGAIGDVKSEVFDANSHLSFIESSAENIETDVEYIDRHVGSIMDDLSDLKESLTSGGALYNLFQLIETNTRTNGVVDLQPIIDEVLILQKNLGNLADGYPLEDSDGEAYDNRISATHYGNSSLTMSDALQFIAQGVGGIDTSGGPHYQNQAVLPLINTIIGWTGGFSNNNIQTNGIIGLLRQANKYLSEINTMTNLVVEKIDEQINIISNGFSYVARSLDSLNIGQTNLLYLNSRPYIPLNGRPNINTYGSFVSELNKGLNITNQIVNSPFYSMAFALPHFVDDVQNLNSIQKYHLRIAGQSFGFAEQGGTTWDEKVSDFASLYHKYYGNLRGYSDTFSDESDGIDETREGASNLVSDATMQTTNSVVRLIPELSVSELLTDWDDFEGVEQDWKREHGPSKEELERIKGYFDASMEESQQEVTFQFDLDFGEGTEIHTGEWNLVADDETIGGMKSAGNKFIKYGASTIKGILVCLFVWHMIEMSIAVINGDAVVG